MLAAPEMPVTMLVTIMDKYALRSSDVKQRWRDAYKYWLTEMKVYHGRSSPSVMEAVYLRVICVCEPEGPRKTSMRLAAAELALRHAKS